MFTDASYARPYQESVALWLAGTIFCASPQLCNSFLAAANSLSEFDANTAYEPFATPLAGWTWLHQQQGKGWVSRRITTAE